MKTLEARTGKPRALVESFCDAVDKKLFLLLDERQRRATLHFHLDVDDVSDEASPSAVDV